jgi:threonine/homoserine/homoserine lactone efflux protein
MIDTLVTSTTFAAFVIASLILAIVPGPAVVYLITQTLSRGRTAGLASIGGIAFGNLANASAASLGLAAVLAASSTAFLLVKLAGAGYLVFLGIKALRTKTPTKAAADSRRLAPSRLFRDGFVVALLNPKTALFFAALLPQFIDPHASALAQSMLLACVFVSIAMCTDTLYVLTASAMASRLRRQTVWRSSGRYVSGAAFIGLGVYAALSGPRATK